ncbi:MAG: GIY-YIG nuclease family protein [Saprospirales bacterium]|nr:GIY-YIG nuclease family protein [Saprospirales bacterium]MBK8921694.1 GIY-YIG nuclease family protein [Saprospirales bacterium]
MRHYIYILQSQVDASFYTGYTSNISRRLQEHNAGLSSFTSRKIPWRLVYFEDFDDKSDALKRERFIKAMRNKNFILNLIRSF